MKSRMESGLGVREGKNILKEKLKLQINIHLINHQQRKIYKIIIF